MAEVIRFEEKAVAHLRDRLGAVEGANADLIAYARGHSGATSAIHEAVLLAMRQPSLEALLACVAREWPAVLGIDCASVALVFETAAFRVDGSGTFALNAAWVDRAHDLADPVLLRSGAHGDPLFGPSARALRCEAIVQIGQRGGTAPYGVLLLGEKHERDLAGGEGTSLLAFLGRSLDAIIARWLTDPTST